MNKKMQKGNSKPSIVPFLCIAPFFKKALKMYSVTYRRFLNFGFQLKLTNNQIPYLVKPNPNHLKMFVVVNLFLLLVKVHKCKHANERYKIVDFIQLAFFWQGILWMPFILMLVRVELIRERYAISSALNKLIVENIITLNSLLSALVFDF